MHGERLMFRGGGGRGGSRGSMVEEDPLPQRPGLHFSGAIDLSFGDRMCGSIPNAVIFISFFYYTSKVHVRHARV